ncbi:MAG TPA: hypothetical protein VK957_06435 [Lunatimonas sp.]|nr:hypothetical protein [Lunatimonas sp.]
MTDIPLIVQQLRNRQNHIEKKINQLLSLNLDPFPFDRLDKGKKNFTPISAILNK